MKAVLTAEALRGLEASRSDTAIHDPVTLPTLERRFQASLRRIGA